jgi:hypothetical protein
LNSTPINAPDKQRAIRAKEAMMQVLHDSRGTMGAADSDEVPIVEFHGPQEIELREHDWFKTLTRRCLTAACVIVLIALPVGVTTISEENIVAQIPLLQALGYQLLANHSAVLAVDATGLVVQAPNMTSTSLEPFENITMNRLANLHRTYSRWAADNEDVIGTLTVKLHVDKAGHVAVVEPLASRLSNADFTRVVLSEIGRWTFPASNVEPVEITIPLLFVPKGMEPSTVVQWERKNRIAAEEGKSASVLRVPENSPMELSRGNVLMASIQLRKNNERETRGDPTVATKRADAPQEATPHYKITRAIGLRDQPRFAARQIQDIDPETAVSVMENKGDWLKVKVASVGAVGFVRKEFIAPLE